MWRCGLEAQRRSDLRVQGRTARPSDRRGEVCPSESQPHASNRKRNAATPEATCRCPRKWFQLEQAGGDSSGVGFWKETPQAVPRWSVRAVSAPRRRPRSAGRCRCGRHVPMPFTSAETVGISVVSKSSHTSPEVTSADGAGPGLGQNLEVGGDLEVGEHLVVQARAETRDGRKRHEGFAERGVGRQSASLAAGMDDQLRDVASHSSSGVAEPDAQSACQASNRRLTVAPLIGLAGPAGPIDERGAVAAGADAAEATAGFLDAVAQDSAEPWRHGDEQASHRR